MILEDPEDLSVAQQRLRERSERERDRSDKDRNNGGSSGGNGNAGGNAASAAGVPISPYGPAAGLVNRLGLSSKMGKYSFFYCLIHLNTSHPTKMK